jgi:hypothetical protein
MAERCNCAVVLLRHLNKGGGSKAIYRGGGSIGIIGAARSGLLVAIDPSRPDARILAVTKSNLTKPPGSLTFRLRETGSGCCNIEWLGASELAADDLVGHQTAGEDGVALQEAKAFLGDFLKNGARPFEEVHRAAHQIGVSDSTLRRAKNALQVRSVRCQTGPASGEGVWVWVLPNQSAELPQAKVAARIAAGGQPTWEDILGTARLQELSKRSSPVPTTTAR